MALMAPRTSPRTLTLTLLTLRPSKYHMLQLPILQYTQVSILLAFRSESQYYDDYSQPAPSRDQGGFSDYSECLFTSSQPSWPGSYVVC